MTADFGTVIGRLLAALAISIALAACAQVNRESAAQFAENSRTVFSTVNAALQSDVTLAGDAALQVAACNYISAGRQDVSPAPLWRPDPVISRRVKLLKALLNYASALHDATDPARFEKMQVAADGLADSFAATGVSVAKAAGPGASALSSPLIGPSARLVSAVLVDLIQIEYQARLHRIAASMDGTVEQAVSLLLSGTGSEFIPQENTENLSLEDVYSLEGRARNPVALRRDVSYLRASFENWRRHRSCRLRLVHADGRIPADRLHALFIEESLLVTTQRAALAALEKTDDVAQALVAIRVAHKALLVGGPAFEPALARIRLYAERLAAVRIAQ